MKKQVKGMMAILAVAGSLVTAGCSFEATADTQNATKDEMPISTMKEVKMMRGNSYNHLVLEDPDTGCQYIETQESLTPYIGSDGEIQGCKDAK